ncbi:apolipoprotein N-acyltransferase [Thioclava sp. F1Mire-8]|uniref:apolipoprotein N-acyltransferase n=1 Tax=Thioclava sp. F1Mire-8 TaxID=1973006 RepID=UPI000B53A268|nr:apolipoprotein N-acyltransferase [Thioclava sp. F1Mire-8]OWY04860.1 apolipoprotein N-acyltransferase [Thioclava sp. F1Mire-8]
MIATIREGFRAPLRPRWQSLALAALFGVLFAAGQAPLGLWWIALPALAASVWFASAERWRASTIWIGFATGFGYALAAMFWIVEPFMVEADVYGWMAPFALVLMAAGMGAFWAIGYGLGAYAGQGPRSRALGIALGMAASDALRSYVFTGFPWVLVGHIWIGSPVAQAAAFVGPLGLSLITLLIASAPAMTRGMRMPAALGIVGAALVVLVGLWLGGVARLNAPVAPRPEPITLRLVQPNAPQNLKWLPQYRMKFFQRLLDLTKADPAPGQPKPDLIVWPETAVPFLLDHPQGGLEMSTEAAGGIPLAMGVQRSEGSRYFNSLAVITPDDRIEALYDKSHLVPFGEYMPFGDALAKIGITAFAAQVGNGYSSGPGEKLLDLGKLGHVAPLICYEAIFPQDLRGFPQRPDWILQVTNDAWFGTLSGPYQHFAQARLRAIEQGLPLARDANTGVTAMIDAKGRITASLGLDRMGKLDVALPPSLPPTLYSKLGDAPFIALIVAALALLSLFTRISIDPTGRRS